MPAQRRLEVTQPQRPRLLDQVSWSVLSCGPFIYTCMHKASIHATWSTPDLLTHHLVMLTDVRMQLVPHILCLHSYLATPMHNSTNA